MSISALVIRAAACVAFAYTLLLLWMAAGLLAVIAYAALLNCGLNLARYGDRPLEDWPLLRRLRLPAER